MPQKADEQLLEEASELAYSAIEAEGDDLSKLTDPLKTVYAVYHATAIMDHGGFLYFFDSDFPQNPPYSLFVDAYRTIGCEAQATALQNAVDSFRIPNPEQHALLRQEYMESHYDQTTQQISTWTDNISGNHEVWQALAAWIRQHPGLQHLMS